MRSPTLGMSRIGVGMLVSWLLVGGVVATPSRAAVVVTFDPVADYDVGWLAGTNPNGAWRYGWSSNLTSSLHLYPRNRTTTQDSASSTYRVWDDPANNVQFVPAIIKNIGPTVNNGNVLIPTGVMTSHTGANNEYSHVLFTAPLDGDYNIALTFTGRQNFVNSDVHILVNGNSVLNTLISGLGQTSSYSGVQSLHTGDIVDLATGPGNVGGLHAGHIGISGTLTVSVPEPACASIIACFGLLVCTRRRRSLTPPRAP